MAWLGAAPLVTATRLARSQRLHIADDLPSFLLRQKAQEGIPLSLSPLVTNQNTSPARYALQLAVDQRGHVAGSLPGAPMTR